MYGTGSGLYRLGTPTPPALRTLPPLPLVVDTVSGSDANVGSAALPVQTLSYAMALCAGLPDWTIKVIAPQATPIRAGFDYNSSFDLTIEGWDDEPWYLYGSTKLETWANTTGTIWRKAGSYAVAPHIIVRDLTETVGDEVWPVRLLPNTTTPTTPAVGQTGYSGGFVYVNMPDGSDPNGHTIEAATRNYGLWTYGEGRLTVRDGVFRHFLLAGVLNGLSTQPDGYGNLTVEDTLIEFAGASGGVTTSGNNEDTVCTRVQSYRALNDGFNHHLGAGGGAALMTLNDCDGSYNGDQAGQSSQGASPHETAHLVINGGRFKYNVSGVGGIQDAVMDLHGDTVHGAIEISNNMRLGNTVGTIASQAGLFWNDTMSGTVTGSVTVSNNGGVGVRVNTADAVTGLENITSTGNALPDEIA